MNIHLPYNELTNAAQSFMDRNPTLLGVHNGVRYYEHPKHGDEDAMWCIDQGGELYRSDFWDMDSVING